ncbi:hypothetical protein LCER1_G004466 [Lachnellula cervina]|uniref:Uncharacterized protein n=1 Tax=Lachnellula cervina TaxID=1316786 RepID=A0A7D8UN72_9HELO|nr:hypothetical protein LCER1_G004466 [Lachnellula cervina]
MGQPSHPASNAIIYLSYGAFLYVEKTILPILLYSVVADLLPESSDAASHGDFDTKQRANTSRVTERRRVRVSSRVVYSPSSSLASPGQELQNNIATSLK